jgi:hypothetical protein
MRSRLIIPVVMLFSNVVAQSPKKPARAQPSSGFIQKLRHTCSRIQHFENAYGVSADKNMEDSIKKYNRRLRELLSGTDFLLLSDADRQKIPISMGIKISRSQDKRISMVSWCIFYDQPVRACSAIAMWDVNRNKIISSTEMGDRDVGNNIGNDTIIDISLDGRTYYVLVGSNKCGNLCVDEIASVYTFQHGEFVKCTRAFFDGKEYADDVEFNYKLTNKLGSEPSFRIGNDFLICPVFDEFHEVKTDEKKYRILADRPHNN